MLKTICVLNIMNLVKFTKFLHQNYFIWRCVFFNSFIIFKYICAFVLLKTDFAHVNVPDTAVLVLEIPAADL